MKSLSIMLLTKSGIKERTRTKMKEFIEKTFSGFNINQEQILLFNNTDSGSRFLDFLDSVPKMSGNGQNCHGSECLANPSGFYSSGIPFLGLPSRFKVTPQTKSVKVTCSTSNLVLELSLIRADGAIMREFQRNTFVYKDIKSIDFIINNPWRHKGKYYCRNSDLVESANFLLIEQSQNSWSDWSSWTKCEKVQIDRVTRSRTNTNGRSQTQKRFCICSDLEELPRPR